MCPMDYNDRSYSMQVCSVRSLDLYCRISFRLCLLKSSSVKNIFKTITTDPILCKCSVSAVAIPTAVFHFILNLLLCFKKHLLKVT